MDTARPRSSVPSRNGPVRPGPPGWPPHRPPDWPPNGPGQPQPPSQRRPENWLEERLFEHRIVLIYGPLDVPAATRAAAQLLTLDATASHRIRVHLDSPDGDLAAALSLTDTLDLLRVSVHLLAVGEVGGPALALLTAADRVLAYPHARFHLFEPKAEISGRADEIATAAQHHLKMLDDFVARLSQTSGKSADEITADLRTGRYLTASEAVDYGLADSLVARESKDSDWS